MEEKEKMKTYNEFRAVYKTDIEKIGEKTTPEGLSEAWTKYKNGKYEPMKKAPVSTGLPEAIKEINVRLGIILKKLIELRQMKKSGKDVKAEIKETLKLLTDTRIVKKAKMKE